MHEMEKYRSQFQNFFTNSWRESTKFRKKYDAI